MCVLLDILGTCASLLKLIFFLKDSSQRETFLVFTDFLNNAPFLENHDHFQSFLCQIFQNGKNQ
jgi:hypothetical protein